MRFWERYLERSGDREMLEVAAPFLAKLLRFVRNVLQDARFDPARANAYCEP